MVVITLISYKIFSISKEIKSIYAFCDSAFDKRVR